MRFVRWGGILLACLPMFGQGARLRLELDHLKEKASEAVNVTLDGALLEQGVKMLALQEKGAALAPMLKDLQGVYVRSFKFERPGLYSKADVDGIRKQLNAPNWSALVEVSEKDGGMVYIYSYVDSGKIGGMAVVAAEPKEMTVVNIVGPIDLSRLGELGGKFGIPDMSAGFDSRTKNAEKKK
jgi:hypothetical protein